MQIVQLQPQAQINEEFEITEPIHYQLTWVGDEINHSLHGNLSLVHNQQDLQSRLTIKCVADKGHTVDLTGNLVINSGSVNTSSYLQIKVLLLDQAAEVKITPCLEIQENEVSCGHGATIGTVDQEHLFYLMSRGLTKKQATDLIVKAFIDA